MFSDVLGNPSPVQAISLKLKEQELHELLFGTFRTQNFRTIGDETFAYQRRFAQSANETIIVPSAVFERDEASATNASYGSGACYTSLGEEFPEAISAVRFIIPGCEALTSEASIAVGAAETFSVPWLITICYTPTGDNLIAFNASSSIFLFIAPSAVNIIITRDKTFCANRIFAHATAEALVVPLMAFVFHLLSASFEDFSTAIASCCKGSVIAICTVHFFSLRSKWFVHKRYSTFIAQETSFVPMLLFVGQIFRINSYQFPAFFAAVRKHLFVASDTVGMLISEHVALAGQRFVALPATEMSRVPVL